MIVKQMNGPTNSVSSLSQLFKYLMTELDLNAGAGAVSRHYFGGKPARYLTESQLGLWAEM